MNKKRFSSMSNIDVVKKYLAGERPYLTVSYNQSERDKYRNEGEEWTADGKQYKKVDGKTVILTKTQGDIIREAIDKAFDCRVCGARWNLCNQMDRKFLSRTGLCQDCLIEHETKLRIAGIYGAYEGYKLASYELGSLKANQDRLLEVIKYFTEGTGDIVKYAESEYDENIVWKNTNKDKILGDAMADLKKVKELIKVGTKVTKTLKKEYFAGLKKFKLPDITEMKPNK